MTTLAEYNNNPGNIRPAEGVTYDGMIGVDDKGFAVFEKPEYGQKALVNDLTHKLEKRGIKTPSQFVDVYAPAGDENDEDTRDNYKIHIAQKLGLKSTDDPFPENAVNKLAQAVTSFENGTWQEKSKTDKTTTNAEEENNSSDNTSLKEPPKPLENPPPPSKDLLSRLPEIGIGAYGGAKIAAGIEGSKKVLPILHNLYDKALGNNDAILRRAESVANNPQSRSGLQRYANGILGHDIRVPLADLEKIYGKPIRTQSEVQSAINQLKPEPRKPMVNPRTGKPMSGFSLPKPGIDLSAYKYNPNFVQKAIDEAKHAGEIVKGALPSAGRVGLGALGGALSLMQLDDAVNQYKKEGEEQGETWHVPSLRNAAQFSGVAGGALSTIPTLPTQLIGAGLTGVSLLPDAYDAALEMSNRRKHATKEDTDRMLMDVDAMGNPL